jgi:hypothetical protein
MIKPSYFRRRFLEMKEYYLEKWLIHPILAVVADNLISVSFEPIPN